MCRFFSILTAHLNKCHILDFVWVVYWLDSLKRETQDSTRKSIQRKVSDQTPVPTKWQGFLHVDDNKTELYNYMSTYVIESMDIYIRKRKCTYCIHYQNVLSVHARKVNEDLSPSSYDEADTRVFFACRSLH